MVVVTRTASVDRRLRARRALQVKYADGANVLHPRLTSYVVREVAMLLDLANLGFCNSGGGLNPLTSELVRTDALAKDDDADARELNKALEACVLKIVSAVEESGIQVS